MSQEQCDLETLHFFCSFCLSRAKSFSLPHKNQATVRSNTSPFLLSEVLHKPADSVSKGLVARKGKARKAGGSGRAANPTLHHSGATETHLHEALLVTVAGRQPTATKTSQKATVVCFQNSNHKPTHPKLRFREVVGHFRTRQCRAPNQSELGQT